MNEFNNDFSNSLPIHFVAGMPRSCSTLLINFIGQNTKFHVTPTNALSVILNNIREGWQKMPAFQAQGLWDNIQPKIKNMMFHMIQGFYFNEFASGKLVFDKDRGWMSARVIRLMEEILNREIRIITTIRDPRSVFASFEKLRNNNPLSSPPLFDAFKEDTQYGRADLMFSKQGVIGSWIHHYREIRDTELANRLIIIPYKKLVTNPIIVINDIYKLLNLIPFEHDSNNVNQITKEDDSRHGYKGLHDIRPKIEPPKNFNNWENILSPQVIHGIEANFADIIENSSLNQESSTNQILINEGNQQSGINSNLYRPNL